MPSFWRVAAINTRGVVVFLSGTENSSEALTQRKAWAGMVASFAGQFVARARIKLAVFHGLDADDGGDAEDVVGIGTARNIGGRTVEAE